MLRRLLLALVVLVLPHALAQEARRIALVPLDSRPATSTLAARIGAVGGLDVLLPPAGMLGDAQRPADREGIERWLTDVAPEALVVSLDALAYGGLVQSRKSTVSADVAWGNLQSVRLWHQVTGRPVHGFVVIPRHPDAVDRARNLAVIRWALEWAGDGTLASLTIGWDDALAGSPAPAEASGLRDEVSARGLGNVLVRPGADELAGVLLARLATGGLHPSLRVEYSRPEDAGRVLPYDAVPLSETVRAQAEAAGFRLAPDKADVTLFVYSGGDARAAALRVSALQRAGEAVAVADVAKVNGVNARLAGDIVNLGAFPYLYGFAGWGTPANNVGTVVAQAAARATAGATPAHAQLLALEYLNDLVYSTVVRPQVRSEWSEAALATPEASADLLARLRAEASAASTHIVPGSRASVLDAGFPWSRSFEAWLSLALQPLPQCGRGACREP